MGEGEEGGKLKINGWVSRGTADRGLGVRVSGEGREEVAPGATAHCFLSPPTGGRSRQGAEGTAQAPGSFLKSGVTNEL